MATVTSPVLLCLVTSTPLPFRGEPVSPALSLKGPESLSRYSSFESREGLCLWGLAFWDPGYTCDVPLYEATMLWGSPAVHWEALRLQGDRLPACALSLLPVVQHPLPWGCKYVRTQARQALPRPQQAAPLWRGGVLPRGANQNIPPVRTDKLISLDIT